METRTYALDHRNRLLILAFIGVVISEGYGPQFSQVLGNANLEGKEVRFGVGWSSLWAVSTTAASSGSVNAMLDSFTPLGGAIPMFLMQLGEIIFGGVGSGLYGMIAFLLLTVFIAGLLVGRTPEYIGKKIEAFDIKMTSIVILTPLLLTLFGAMLMTLHPDIMSWLTNQGAHGFSELLYAATSFSNNNGSAFGGLTADTVFLNSLGSILMFVSRFVPIAAILYLAENMGAKKKTVRNEGTLSTTSPVFVTMLIIVIIVIGALSFFTSDGFRTNRRLFLQRNRREKNEKIYQWAIGESFKKLDPRQQIKNPVMFVVYLGAILTTILCFQEQTVPLWFSISVTVFLWLTILFANFAEAVAEGRGKAQADSLKQAKKKS